MIKKGSTLRCPCCGADILVATEDLHTGDRMGEHNIDFADERKAEVGMRISCPTCSVSPSMWYVAQIHNWREAK
jgi:DNA-directed RNA polymerase subunit RPC12/RpoP